MASHNDLGRRGEEIAKDYLENIGYGVIKLNWTYGKAEVDVIAYHKDTLVFVEVKTRTSIDYGEPEDFVNIKKERQLEYAAEAYIEMYGHHGEIRFDIIAIVFENKHLYKINHIEDAFWPS